MKEAFLKRLEDNGTQTLGIFFFETDEGTITLCSLELPWKDNVKNISCIPKGTYEVKTTFSNRFQKDMWQIMDVPDRAGVRIHSANYFTQIQGCIALGLGQDDINEDGNLDIISSKKAMEIAANNLGKEFKLEIS